jgi:hypothetical protein
MANKASRGEMLVSGERVPIYGAIPMHVVGWATFFIVVFAVDFFDSALLLSATPEQEGGCKSHANE